MQKNRIAAIDILRAGTMLLMIFVNDLWSIKNIPLWLEHTAANEDCMGLADTVFPAFLFIVGLSIPLAIAARKAKGDSTLDIAWHIMLRSFALVVMGVFLVNGEYLNEAASGMQRVTWNMICVTCFIVIWNAWPGSFNRNILRVLKMLAIFTLGVLAWICRGGEGSEPGFFSPYWWGILGLIGWAYMVSALIYAFGKANLYVTLVAWLCFLGLCVANHANWLPQTGLLRTLVSPIGEGAMTALVLGGVVVSQLFSRFVERYSYKKMLTLFLMLAALLVIAGFGLRPLGGISKIKATPSWVLICSGITVAAFMLVYYLATVLKKETVFEVIKPAGTNTLMCYLLPYYAYGITSLFKLHLPAFLLTGGIGLIKSLAFAMLMVIIAGWLGRRNLRLKL